MTLTVSQVAHNALGQMYGAMAHILEKAAGHAAEKGVAESTYLNWRLTPDMLPMVKQIQIATEISARGMARLAGAEVPSYDSNEDSFAALIDRVKSAKAYIDGLDNAAIDADPESMVTFPTGGSEMSLSKVNYLQNFLLPNLYFHVTTAYGLLRACGVPLGKMDYMMGGVL